MSIGRRFSLWLLLAASGGALLSCARSASAREERAADAGIALFRSRVQPLITGKCLTCHASDKKKGGLDLTRRTTALAGGESGAAIVPGKPEQSLLLQKVAAAEMPPKNPLTPEQVAALKDWIAAGAPYENEPLRPNRAGPDWWSLQPVKRPALPVVKNSGWVRNPIDAFILAKLEAAGLEPAPEVCRPTFIRRATFDLLGLPPTPEEIAAFVNDPAPDAHERLIDRLLGSPHYGERWGRHWLDVVRFGESHGYETNQLRSDAWPYRDYIIRAFNQDTPFARFVFEQLAGDALPEADWLTQAATGFLVGGVHDVVGNQTPEGMAQQRMDDLDDMITATGTAFLGLTTNCARCHDHKFDPVTQHDYYGLQAVFAGVQHAERDVPAPDADRRNRESARIARELAEVDQRLEAAEPVARKAAGGGPLRPAVQPRRNVDRFEPVAAKFVRFTVLATNNLEPCIDELEVMTVGPQKRNVALARSGAKATASGTYPNSTIHRLEHLNDGSYGNSRSWISNEAGRGWVQIELPEVSVIDRVVWGRDREEKFKDRLATAYFIEVAREPGEWRVVASSEDRLPYQADAPAAPSSGPQAPLLERQKTLRDQLAALAPTMKIYAGAFATPGPAHILLRGDPLRPGDAVAPSAIAAVKPPLALDASAPERDRRAALARWLGHPDNPLPARVMVNRLWHYHFGQGIVATPSDFGFQGGQPSHPELLDWLASEFLASGGRLKPLHRLMMLSAAYRQGSELSPEAAAIDRNNRLCWRMPPRRLEAEALRDALLAVSGQLDRRMGGPGYYIWEKNTNYVTVFTPRAALGPAEFRRMVYQFKPRTQQDPTFGAFDCPDAALVAPRRNISTTALQALNLFNSRFALAQAEAFASRLRSEAGDSPERQVDRAFALAFGRRPSATELAAATALVRDHGTAAFCRALCNANEFLYVP